MAKKMFKQIKSETELYEASDLYTKSEVDSMLGSPMHYKGNVPTVAALEAITEKQNGDLYNVTATGKNYVWNADENEWDDISGVVSLTNYYTKDETNAAFATKGELTTLSGTVTNHTGNDAIHVTQADKTAWNNKQAKIEVSGILKGDGTGGVSAAVAGTDYVAPVAGKGLSTEDYTSDEKTKLGGIEAGAEKNVIETVKVNGTPLTPDSNKAVDIVKGNSSTYGVVKLTSNVPMSLEDCDADTALNQEVGYFIGQQMSGKQTKITANGILKGNGSGGVSAAVAGTDYVAPSALNNYVPTSRKVNNKALSADIELDGGDITTTYTHDDTVQVQTVDEAFTRTMTQIEGVRTLANGKIANAVSNVKVGNTTISTSGEDTLEIVGSGSVTVTPDATNKKITISSSSAVTSVNGKTGAVVLGASDVGAAEETHTHAISDVTGLQTALNAKANANELTITNGSSSDKKTIQLKSGTSQEVLVAHQDISGKVDKSTLTEYLTTNPTTGVLKAFPTENYSIEELVIHYNNLLTALRNMIGTLS